MGCFGDSPDMQQAAITQGAQNRETAQTESQMNNPNVVAPGYQVQYHENIDPVTNLPGRPTKEMILAPTQRDTFNMQQDLLKYLTSQMQYNQDKMGEALGTDYKLEGAPVSDISGKYAPAEYYQTDAGIDTAPGLYSNLDYSWASQMPTADAATRDRVTQSIYDRGARLLDQSYGTRQQQLDSKLSNQGIFAGSQGYGNAQGALAQQRQNDYNDLAMRAIEAGGAEMQRDFGMGLQARQQSTKEVQDQGTFRNNARSQLVQELLAAQNQKNTAVTQAFNTALAQAGLSNTARQQAMSELQTQKLLPINTLMAVLNGNQVDFQKMVGNTTPTQIAPPPTYQAAAQQGNLQAAQEGQAASAAASIAGLIAAMAMAS